MMRFVIVAAFLTALYVALTAWHPEAAEGAAWFYLGAVLILVVAQRHEENRHG